MTVKPNLLILGAMRSGTTSAYRYLSAHPDIYMTPFKEPSYLAFRNGPPGFCGPGDSRFVEATITDEAAYLQLFEPGAGHRYRGEASAMYLYLPDAMQGIEEVCPDARCLVILRDPVHRAHSSFQYLRTRQMETLDSFAAGLEQEPSRIAAGWAPMWHYTRAGKYADQLERLFATVPREHVHVMTHDDLSDRGPAALEPFLDLLGLDPFPVEVPAIVHNRSGQPRHRHLERLLSSSARKRKLKERLPRPVGRAITRGLRSLDRWRSTQIQAETDLSLEIEAELRLQLQDDLKRTEALTDIDLSGWGSSEDQL